MKDSISSRVYESSTRNKIDKKIKYLNIELDSSSFMGIRIVTTIIIFILFFVFNKDGYIVAPLVSLIYYILFEVVFLDILISKRKKELENNALDFFPCFLLSLKSGRSIKKALLITTEIVNNNLSKDLSKILNEVKLGTSLEESLINYKNLCPSESVGNIMTCLIEAQRYGNNINKTINNELQYIEYKKKDRIITNQRILPLKMFVTFITFIIIILLSIVFVYTITKGF